MKLYNIQQINTYVAYIQSTERKYIQIHTKYIQSTALI